MILIRINLFIKNIHKGVLFMLDLKNLSEKELAKRLLDYINRAEQLENTISDFMKNKRDDSDVIRKSYKELKDALNEEYIYLSKA